MSLTLPEKIREILTVTELDQAGLAAALGVTHQRIRNLAAGRVQKLDETEAKALVHKLHIRGDWLATGEGSVRQTKQEMALERSQQLMLETTQRATSLDLEPDRQIFVRDILWGVAMDNTKLLNATIDGLLAARKPKRRTKD